MRTNGELRGDRRRRGCACDTGLLPKDQRGFPKGCDPSGPTFGAVGGALRYGGRPPYTRRTEADSKTTAVGGCSLYSSKKPPTRLWPAELALHSGCNRRWLRRLQWRSHPTRCRLLIRRLLRLRFGPRAQAPCAKRSLPFAASTMRSLREPLTTSQPNRLLSAHRLWAPRRTLWRLSHFSH